MDCILWPVPAFGWAPVNSKTLLYEDILTLKGVLKDTKVSDRSFSKPWDCYVCIEAEIWPKVERWVIRNFINLKKYSNVSRARFFTLLYETVIFDFVIQLFSPIADAVILLKRDMRNWKELYSLSYSRTFRCSNVFIKNKHRWMPSNDIHNSYLLTTQKFNDLYSW